MILRGPYPDVAVPDATLPDFVLGDLDPADADRLAVIAAEPGGRSYTYRRLVAAIDRMAAGLARRGIGPGDVVALFAPNSPDYPVAFHGALRAGAMVSPVNALYTPRELAHQLRDSGAAALVTTGAGLDRAREAVTADGVRVREVLVLDGAGPLTEPGRPPTVAVGPDDLAALPYSSGTTGLAKGVMLTHRNLTVNIRQLAFMSRMHAGSRVLAVLPLFHIYGITGLMNQTLYRRARLVTMARFDLAEFLAAIQRHRIDHLYIAPPIALLLARSPLVDEYDLSSVELVTSAAAPLNADLARELERRLDVTAW